jgi:acetylglutamate kinase
MSRELRPDLVVIKLGGTTLADQRALLEEIATIRHTRSVVVVHGGGKRLTDWLERLGVQSRFEGGLRVTDESVVEAALAVLGGVVNGELVGALRALGVDAFGLTGLDGGLLIGRRMPGLGLVAHVAGVRRYLLDHMLGEGSVPVVAPLALDEQGVVCNVNADDAAAGISGALTGRLVLLTDVAGVLDADGAQVGTLTAAEAEGLIADGVIGGGMIPKVRACLDALEAGALEAVIADGSEARAIERALEDPAFGTRIVPTGTGDGSSGASSAERGRAGAPIGAA